VLECTASASSNCFQCDLNKFRAVPVSSHSTCDLHMSYSVINTCHFSKNSDIFIEFTSPLLDIPFPSHRKGHSVQSVRLEPSVAVSSSFPETEFGAESCLKRRKLNGFSRNCSIPIWPLPNYRSHELTNQLTNSLELSTTREATRC
jgi:hypothetical protein